jgi:hypothetical protein
VVLVTVVSVAPAAATSAALASSTSRPDALGPVAPVRREVVAEVGTNRLADPVEVDPDGLEGLAVLGVAGRCADDGLVAVGPVGARLALDVVLGDQVAGTVEVKAVVVQGGVRRAPRVGEQAEQEVAGADLTVAELAGDVRRLGDGNA